MAAWPTLPSFKAPTDSSTLCHILDGCTIPPPPPPPSYDSTTIRFQHTSLLPALPVAAASLVVAASLAFLLAFLIVRLRRRRRRRRLAAVSAAGDPDAVLDGGDGEEAVHHVWYIRTVGLDEPAIQSITAWAYKAGEGVLGDFATDCTVCLSDFRDGELVRLLPRCTHAFHLSCIDTWLRSHVNCPLCRAPIVAPNTAVNSGDPGTSTAFSSSSSSSSSSSLPALESGLDHTNPDSISSAPADSNQTDGRQLEAVGGTVQVQMECERLDLGGRNQTVVDPPQIPDLLVSVDIGEDGFQHIRRSVSMDSFISVLKLDEDISAIPNRKNPAYEEEWKERSRAKHSSISSFRKEVGISLVSASGRFFFSVQGRARSSVLPV